MKSLAIKYCYLKKKCIFRITSICINIKNRNTKYFIVYNVLVVKIDKYFFCKRGLFTSFSTNGCD